MSVDPPTVQRGEDTDNRQVRRADAGERQRFENRGVAEARLLGHGSDDSMDEGLMGRDIVSGVTRAEGRNGAGDKGGKSDPHGRRFESPRLH